MPDTLGLGFPQCVAAVYYLPNTLSHTEYKGVTP
jgi:hypothetical protein